MQPNPMTIQTRQNKLSSHHFAFEDNAMPIAKRQQYILTVEYLGFMLSESRKDGIHKESGKLIFAALDKKIIIAIPPELINDVTVNPSLKRAGELLDSWNNGLRLFSPIPPSVPESLKGKSINLLDANLSEETKNYIASLSRDHFDQMDTIESAAQTGIRTTLKRSRLIPTTFSLLSREISNKYDIPYSKQEDMKWYTITGANNLTSS
jgi:hypothetical protein